MSKRIVYVTSDLDRYGTDAQLLALALDLPRDEFDVHVCSLREVGERGADLKAAGIPLTSVDRRWPCDPLAALRLKRLLSRLQPDLIHSGGSAASVYGRAAAGFASHARLIASAPAAGGRQNCALLGVDRFLSARASVIVTADQAVRDALARQGWPLEKLVVVPAGFTASAASDRSRADVTAEIGLPADVYLIGLLGRLEADQGWKEVIWTLDILRCLRDDVHVVVVGEGRQRWQLERFARLCTLDSHVHFLGRRGDVATLLPHFNHVWQGPGSGDPAFAAAESLAAGVPVVASDTANNRQLVIHDQTGFLVPTGDRAARARYANRLINDPALRTRLGEAGRRRTATQFAWKETIARHVELYRRLVGA